MSANIRVVCRFRPQNDRELKEGGKAIIHVIGDTVNIKGEESNHTFTFDRIYTDKSSQKEIFEDVAKPMIEDIFRGYNGTIFVYGQTSSGKTHTMMGPDGGKAIEDPNLKGLVPRIVVALFQSIQQASEDIEFLVKVSYVEIYMEKIRDLLDISKNNLAIREDKTKGIWLDGVSEVYVAEEKDVLEIMKQGTANRAIAPTKMNFESSRSHSLFIITIQQKDLKNLSNKTGKLYLVDLAGSEKISKTGAEGQTLEEAKMINKSLSTLGNVINALTDGKSSHIPYRDSKLTRMLSESLGGNSRTTLIINCSPSSYNEAETLSTLRFGNRAKSIKNKPKINQELSAAELKLLLAKAEKEIARLSAQLQLGGAAAAGALLPEGAPLPQEMKERIDELEQRLRDADEQTRVLEAALEAASTRAAAADAARDELAAMRAADAAAQAQTQALQTALSDLRTSSARELQELRERLVALEAQAGRVAPLEARLAQLQTDLEHSRAQEQRTRQANETQAEELQQLRSQNEELKRAAEQAQAAESARSQDEWKARGDQLKASLQQDLSQLDVLESSLQSPSAPAPASLQSLQETLQKLEAQNAALQAELVAAKAAPAAAVAGSGDQAREVDALRSECELLRAAVKERDDSRARDEQRAHKLEADLRMLREATTSKLGEFDQLKAALLKDLQTRCEKIVDLELLLEEAREQYEDLLKNSAARAAQKRVQQLEQAMEALTADHARLAQQLAASALDKEVAEKKLSARTERISALESVLATAQEKLLTQAASHQTEIAKYRAIIDSFRSKQSQQPPQLPAGLAAPHGPRIVRPLRGGVRSAAPEDDDSASASAPTPATPKAPEKSGSFWGSLFGSTKKVPPGTPAPATGAVSPRADSNPPAPPATSPRPPPSTDQTSF